jgi:plastocyanin
MSFAPRGRNARLPTSLATVSLRRLSLPIAGVLGAAIAVLPTVAAGSSPPSTASFKAFDFGWSANGGTATKLTLAQGGTVAFSYPSGRSEHNADFGEGPRPSSCAQTAGSSSGSVPPLPRQTSSGSVPPLPRQPTGAGWTGTCRFNTPGAYAFHCDLHTFMTGTIVVEGPAGSPLAGRPSRAISIPPKQRGTIVRGSAKISNAGVGGRLEVDLRTSARSLGRHGNGLVRVGRLTNPQLRAGTVRFTASLDAAAKRALRRQGQLTLTVAVTVRSTRGTAGSLTRRVTLRT